MSTRETAVTILVVVSMLVYGCLFYQDLEKLDRIHILLGEDQAPLLSVGEVVSLRAVGVNARGQTVELTNPTWTVSDDGLGTLNTNTGDVVEFTSTSTGSVTVMVTAQDDVTASIDLTVATVLLCAQAGKDFTNSQGWIRHLSPTVRSGYSSEIFIIGWDYPGNWVEWEMEIPEDGDYQLVMLYATGNDPNSTGVKRSLRLKESDNSLTTLLDEIFFPKFGDSGRSGWALKITEPVYIEAGTQTINMMALDFGADATGKVSLNVVWVGFLSVEPSDVVLGEDEIIDLVNEQLGIEPVLP